MERNFYEFRNGVNLKILSSSCVLMALKQHEKTDSNTEIFLQKCVQNLLILQNLFCENSNVFR